MRQEKGQSLVEYALGLGCVAALCMVALGSLGSISSKILHGMEHAINYGGSISSHTQPMVKTTAQPWNID